MVLGVRNRTIEVRMIPSNPLDFVVEGNFGIATVIFVIGHGFVSHWVRFYGVLRFVKIVFGAATRT